MTEFQNSVITILRAAADVLPYVTAVRRAADTERESLGFFASTAYLQFADQEKMLIALLSTEKGRVYAGHLIFGGAWPHRRVFQTYVAPAHRRSGVGRRLVHELISIARQDQCSSVTARVANDLDHANRFYERLGFSLVASKIGGKTRGRTINLRVRELDTPDLFRPSLQRAELPDLRLGYPRRISAPYVLDINVVFDLIKQRARAAEAGLIIRAGLSHVYRLAIAREFVVELERSSTGIADPILDMARQLPILIAPSQSVLDSLVATLAPHIFPQHFREGKLSQRDSSDLKHLATAIHHGAAGFITSEKAILRAGTWLRSNHGLDVLGLIELAATLKPSEASHSPRLDAITRGFEFAIQRPTEEQLKQLGALMEALGMATHERTAALAPGLEGAPRPRLVISENGRPVAFASWSIPQGTVRLCDLILCADEDNPAAELAIEHLLDRVEHDASRMAPTVITASIRVGHAITRRAAAKFGYRPPLGLPDENNELKKASLGQVVLPRSWERIRNLASQQFAISLPKEPPKFQNHTQEIELTTPTGTVLIPLDELELLLSPTLFMLVGRDAVVLPIRRPYAEDLFRAAVPQSSMLPASETIFRRERAYFGSPRILQYIREGSILLFYESSKEHGRAAIFAAARAIKCYPSLKSDAETVSRARGALTKRGIEKISASDHVAVIVFESIVSLRKQVGIKRLRQLGCVAGSNFVTAQPLKHTQAVAVLAEAFD